MPTKMVSWNDAMNFANAVAFVSGWDDDEEDE
jgi:hypothetical protein